ncbi:hypothetical protein DL98DRAFT_532960 [Cadophora sp. DSE1049]|nr:hypothetical protein DL98DRAFT_532960 [Cadophora sp. DSE1049]
MCTTAQVATPPREQHREENSNAPNTKNSTVPIEYLRDRGDASSSEEEFDSASKNTRSKAPISSPTRSTTLTTYPEPTAPTFHRFMNLPDEVKLSILEAATCPRIVIIKMKTISKGAGESCYSLPSDSRCRASSYTGLLGASHFTRDFMINKKVVQHAFRTFMAKSIPVVIDSKTDILYFDKVGTLERFLQVGGPEARQEVRKQCIRRVAVGYKMREPIRVTPVGGAPGPIYWQVAEFQTVAKAVNWFGGLEKLYLVENGWTQHEKKNLEWYRNGREMMKGECSGAIEEELSKWKGLWGALEKATGKPCNKWVVPELEVVMRVNLESKM